MDQPVNLAWDKAAPICTTWPAQPNVLPLARAHVRSWLQDVGFPAVACDDVQQIGAITLPSDFLLQRLDMPLFRVLFQLMIFGALLESGTGAVHAVNERLAHAWRRRSGHSFGRGARLAIALVILTGCMFLAARFGLVALIANGYRLLAAIFLLVYVLPVLTIGLYKLRRGTVRQEAT
jgi:uncharacterized membrane protein YkvI